MPRVKGDSVAERFIAAFSAADFGTMSALRAPILVAWVTDAEGEMARLVGRDDYLGRVRAMGLPAARFSVELTRERQLLVELIDEARRRLGAAPHRSVCQQCGWIVRFVSRRPTRENL
jgi:hypothetical protein